MLLARHSNTPQVTVDEPAVLRMKLLRRASLVAGLAGALLSFFATSKRWWLIPMVIVLFLFALITIAGQSSVISPFVYTLF